MNGLEELINMRDKGYKWLTINRENWAAHTFKELPYWNGDEWDVAVNSNGVRERGMVDPYNGEKFELQQQKGLEKPIPIGKAIEILQQYHQRVDMANESDMVNHPKHYTSGNIEVWDFIIDQDLNYCRGSAVKYISRAGKKDDAIQDLNKAIRFLEREIKRLETGK